METQEIIDRLEKCREQLLTRLVEKYTAQNTEIHAKYKAGKLGYEDKIYSLKVAYRYFIKEDTAINESINKLLAILESE